MMHINTIIIALFISGFLLPATAQQKYTLSECIDIALENNRNIKQQEIGRQQREIAYSQARADLLLIVKNQIETTRANLQRRSELVKSGKMAQGELYELEAQLAREELNRVQAENNLTQVLGEEAQAKYEYAFRLKILELLKD